MYSTNVNGQATQFATSGLVYRSNKLMFDRTTNTLWSHFGGEPVVGHLVGSGLKLDLLPVLLTTWQEWVGEHPDTKVMDIRDILYLPEAYLPEDDIESAYYSYFHSPNTAYPVWERSDLLDTKDVVLALSIGDETKAYPTKTLRKERVVNDSLGGTGLVVIASPTSQAARAYERGGHTFTALSEDAGTDIVDSDGTVWSVTEDYLISTADPAADRLARLPSHMTFWFAWYAFHTDTRVYGIPGE